MESFDRYNSRGEKVTLASKSFISAQIRKSGWSQQLLPKSTTLTVPSAQTRSTRTLRASKSLWHIWAGKIPSARQAQVLSPYPCEIGNFDVGYEKIERLVTRLSLGLGGIYTHRFSLYMCLDKRDKRHTRVPKFFWISIH